jgi:hypothetical protein
MSSRSVVWSSALGVGIALACLIAAAALGYFISYRLEITSYLKQDDSWATRVYEDGRIARTLTISRQDDAYRCVLTWAARTESQRRWRIFLGDVVPGILFYSSHFRLDVHPNLVLFGHGRFDFRTRISAAEHTLLTSGLTHPIDMHSCK